MAETKKQNREDLIKAEIKLSQLKSQKERLTAETKELEDGNAKIEKENGELDTKNEKLLA